MLKEVKIELTNKCSRNCKHCSSNATSSIGNLKVLGFDDVSRIIKEPRYQARDTINPLKNKGKTTICQLYQPRVLVRDTIKFKNVYEHQMWNVDYTYEVELVSLNDLVGEHSVVHTKEFKEFAKEELEKKKIWYMMKMLILEIYILLIFTLKIKRKMILKDLIS